MGAMGVCMSAAINLTGSVAMVFIFLWRPHDRAICALWLCGCVRSSVRREDTENLIIGIFLVAPKYVADMTDGFDSKFMH